MLFNILLLPTKHDFRKTYTSDRSIPNNTHAHTCARTHTHAHIHTYTCINTSKWNTTVECLHICTHTHTDIGYYYIQTTKINVNGYFS